MKILKIGVLCVIVTILQCCRLDPRHANLENVVNLKEGMSESEVREIMTLEPIKVREKDSVWAGEWIYPAKTLIYDVPFMASDLISLSFTAEDSLFAIYYDF